MSVRTLFMPALIGAIGIAGCRSDNANLRSDRSGARPSTAEELPIAGPIGPSVIGVNTSGGDRQGKLSGMRVAILATDGFEQAELVEPRQAYADEGATTAVIAPKMGEIQGYQHDEKGDVVKVDLQLADADPGDFDALLLPGGVLNSDKLRLYARATGFVRDFAHSGKPIAAICHGLWTMVDADVVRGRTVTSWPTLKADLTNAGAKWVDQEVAEDRNFVTSRQPEDIPAFNEKAIALFSRRRANAPSRRAIGGGPGSR
jgi:protease I